MIGPSAPVRTRRSRTTLTIAVVVSQLAALLTLLVTTAPPAAAAPACGTGATAGAINLTPLSNTGVVSGSPAAAPAGTVWYQDASIAPAINSHYIGYKVTNLTGAAVNGYWVKVDGFSAASGTSFLGLATGETGTDQLGNLANGSNDNSYFYLTSGWTGASGQPSFAAGVNTSQMHVVHVYDRRPDLAGAVEVCNTTYGFSNMVNTLQAAANKVNNTVATANPPTIGSLMTMTVWGETGTLGSGQPNDPRRFDMSPATYGTWPVGTFRLEKVQVDLDLTTASPTAPAGTKNCDNNPVNGQPIPSPGPTNLDYLTYQFSATASASRCYLAVYTFRIIGTTSGTTAVSPVQEIASGTQTKHTNIDSAYASIAPIAIPENTLTLSKSASPTLLTAAGGTTTYSVTLNASNCITSTPCPATAQVDSLVDVLPAGTSYVPGTATFNGSAIADPVISGQTLTWVGPWVTPQPGSRTFTYQVTIPAGASQQYVNSATAPIGTVQIDTTLSLADNAPATATVRTRPAVANDSYSTTAGQTLTVAAAGVLANDSGSSLTVATNTNPASGTLTQNANGSLTYVPAAGFSGIVTYTYNVTDVYGNAAPSAATVTIVVNPDAIDDSYSTSANTALTVNAASGLLANDKGTGTGLSVTAVGTPSSGSVSVNGDGSFTYTPATNFTGNATFTYTACLPPPNGTMCDTATATIVVGLPPAPVASNDSYTVTAGGTLTVAAPGVLGNDTGTGITVTANTSPASGSLTQNANGSLTYTPAAGFSGVVTYGYSITDGFTRTSSATVTIVVGPDAVDDTGTTTAGTPLTASVAGNDTFAVGSAFAKATNPANGTASVTSGGSYTYTPNAGFFGVDSFTYTLCLPAPNASTCDTATVTVTVKPDAVDDAVTTPSGTTLNGTVTGNDLYPGGSTFSKATNPTSGSATVNSDGTFSYTPNPGFFGTDSFTYTVCLPSPNQTVCDTATVTVTVGPDAVNDAFTSYGSGSFSSTVTGNDVFPVGSTFAKASNPGNGTATVNSNGTFTYTPNPGFFGVDSFTYTLCLPSPNQTVCDTATVTITVAPDAVNDSASVTAGQTLNATVAGNDAYPAGSTFAKATDPAHGSVTVNSDGTYSYTPTAGFSGTDSFTYTVCLPSPNQTICDTATVTITVSPDAVNDAYSVAAGSVLGVTAPGVLGNDLGTNLSVTSFTNGSHGNVGITAGGTLAYVPAAGFSGTDTFTYTITGDGGSDTATVTVTVTPDAVNDSYVTLSGQTLTVNAAGGVLANDLGTAKTVAVLSTTTNGTLTLNADGSFAYTPNGGFFGTDTFTYTLTADGGTDTATVTITVGPDAVDDAFTSYGSGSFSSTVTGNDVFPVGSTFAKASNPGNGTATVNSNGTFTYTPNPGFFGVDSFTYTLCLPSPNQAVCDTATVTITVAPDAVNDSASVTAGQTLNATVAGNDAYPAGSTFAKATDPAHGSVTVNSDGTYSYTPTAGFSGTDSFTYTVCLPSPNQTICDTATVTITVSPDAVDDAYSAVAGGTLTVAAPGVRSNDVGTNTTVAVLSTTANGSLTLNSNGSFTYTANAGFSGTDTFTYTLTGDGGSDTATVTITVAPDAVNDSYSTPFNTTLTVSAASGVLANDLGTAKTVAVLSTTTNGTLTLNADGSFAYVPTAGFNGTDTFTYTLTADGGTDTATATISVGLPAAPVAVDDSGSTAAGQALTVTAPGVLANDTGTGITLTSSTNPTHGTAAVNADGSYTYTPNAGFSGTDTFTYTITDAYGRTDTATVTITVTPVATDDTYNATTGQTLTVTAPGVLTNDLGTTKTVAVLATTSNGTLSLNADGSFSYTPGNGFSGTDSFTYTLTADGGTDTATVTIDVDPDAVDDSYTTLAGQTLVVPVGTGVLSNDLGTNLSVTANTNPAGGTVSVNPDGSFTYTPNPGFSGTDTFSYAACMPPPNGGRCAVATVSILVDNPPVATTDIVGNANANATTTVNLLPNDTDPDNDPLAVVSVTQPTSGGTVTKVGNTAQYKPPFNFTGYDVFTYTITDGHGGFSTATVHVRIGPTGLVYNDKYYPISIGGTTVNPTPGTPTPGTYDRIALTGSTRFTNQVLVVTLRDGFVPQLGDTFDVWTATSVTGAFAVVQGTVLPDGKVFDVQYLNDRVRLVVVGGIEVDSTADAVDANPADGICAAASGRCTLRAATQEANARAGQQAILTAPLGTYTLAIAGAGEDASATGDLDLTGPTTWYAQRATLDAALLDRGVHVLSGATLNATQLTVTNGRALSGPVPGAGAIFVEGASVVLSDVNLSGNSGQVGGALGTVSGQTLLNRGVITGNSATTSGGGLALFGPTVLDGVAVIGNTSGTFGGGMSVGGGGAVTVINAAVKTNSAPYGGGIVTGAPGTTAITQSVVQGNTASILGGGVAASGTVTLTDARVTGNAAPQGGGLYNGATGAATMTATRVTFDGNTGSTRGGAVANAGTLTIATSTLSGNVAGDGSGLAQLSGGASAPVATVTSSTITRGSSSGTGAGALLSQAGTVTVTNSIVADQLQGASCSTTKVGIGSTGYDHASDATCGFTAVGDVQTGSALLGALGTNGGYSPTHKPLAGSPVINTGAASCGATDQRNWLRPRGGACEKGAIEV